ncbi:hypothetical protein [Halogranum rubrum]|uniref:hypothetical protein n=1 Tax=Halogranum rubrum TaxID=553466 RepID=UPI000B7C6079|nr:hypothetical protein [Halogranum rubrum]
MLAIFVVGYVADAILDVMLPGDPFGDFLPLALGVVGAFVVLTAWSYQRQRQLPREPTAQK